MLQLNITKYLCGWIMRDIYINRKRNMFIVKKIHYSFRPGVEFAALWYVTKLETVVLDTDLILQMTTDKAIVL